MFASAMATHHQCCHQHPSLPTNTTTTLLPTTSDTHCYHPPQPTTSDTQCYHNQPTPASTTATINHGGWQWWVAVAGCISGGDGWQQLMARVGGSDGWQGQKKPKKQHVFLFFFILGGWVGQTQILTDCSQCVPEKLQTEFFWDTL